MSKIPSFYYLNEDGLNTVWKYVSHGKDFVWVKRLGDAITLKIFKDDFITKFNVLRSQRLNTVLAELYKKESAVVQCYIYDVYIENENDGKWYILYKTNIHTTPVCREAIRLK